MDRLMLFFPLSASVSPGSKQRLIITVLIYLAACAVLRVLSVVLGWIPLVGWLLDLVFSLAGLYCVVGIVLAILRCFKH